EKRRAREEEKRERMERRNESELKDKQERQDIKKVIEFRNSRLERSNESSVKEKERTKIRTYRAGNCSYNGAIEKSGKWCDINDRDKCVQSSKKGRDTSAGSDPFSKKTKQNDENQCFKAEKVEELEREKTIKKDEGRTIFKKTISSNDTVEAISPDKLDTRVSRATSRILVHKTTAAEKDERNSDKGKKEEKTENGFTKPRRNKDRPERAIYQPSAARRRAAALAADGLSAMEKVASASKDKL
ncbi:hypothetical protein WUBG_06021, partial [Wuchereria bancrofti]